MLSIAQRNVRVIIRCGKAEAFYADDPTALESRGGKDALRFFFATSTDCCGVGGGRAGGEGGGQIDGGKGAQVCAEGAL